MNLRLSLLRPSALKVVGTEPALKLLYARANIGFDETLQYKSKSYHIKRSASLPQYSDLG